MRNSKKTKQTLDLHDWIILDALAEDYESVEAIIQISQEDWPSAPLLEVIDRLECLCSAGYVFLTLGEVFNRDELIREIDQTDDRRFWFGRTPSGTKIWAEQASGFGYE
jgi:hypothetical protein